MADDNRPLDPNYIYRKRPLSSVAKPVSYEQRKAAVQDPRYAQAIGERVQADVQQRQQQLQQQLSQFQQQYQEAQQQAPAGGSIQDILGKIRAGTATDQDIAQYQKLQAAQYKGPTGLQGAANFAALSQLAQSPYSMATTYGGFVPQRGALQQQQALSGMRGGALGAGMESAQMLAAQATGAEQAAAAQAAALQAQTEQIKQEAQTAIEAEKAGYFGQLGETAKEETKAKEAALEKIKGALFGLDTGATEADFAALNLSTEDLYGLDLSQIESMSGIDTLAELKAKMDELGKKKDEDLTFEERAVQEAYKKVTGLTEAVKEQDTSRLAYARPEDLAKINALLKLTGESEVQKSDLAKGFSGGMFTEEATGLSGELKDLFTTTQEEAETAQEEYDRAVDEFRLDSRDQDEIDTILNIDPGNSISDLKTTFNTERWNDDNREEHYDSIVEKMAELGIHSTDVGEDTPLDIFSTVNRSEDAQNYLNDNILKPLQNLYNDSHGQGGLFGLGWGAANNATQFENAKAILDSVQTFYDSYIKPNQDAIKKGGGLGQTENLNVPLKKLFGEET
jgi:hypothetical protein